MDVNSTAVVRIICGPTASGKTAAALALAEKQPLEVVSADSRQIIRHLDIGTAKPTPQERARLPMHLIDIIEPGERYSAFRFIDDATRVIDDIFGRDRTPLVVGGTGLYLRALSEGVVEIDTEDMNIRDRLEREMEQIGPEKMHQRLGKIDPLEAAKVHPNNKVRVIRALEIFHITGKCKSELTATGAYRKSKHRLEYHCLLPERGALYEKINVRVEAMMAAGWLEEVRQLCEEGRRNQILRSNVIGYSELLDHLDGTLSLDEAVSVIKQSTRRYAKRQMTWFRNQTSCIFYQRPQELAEALVGA